MSDFEIIQNINYSSELGYTIQTNKQLITVDISKNFHPYGLEWIIYCIYDSDNSPFDFTIDNVADYKCELNHFNTKYINSILYDIKLIDSNIILKNTDLRWSDSSIYEIGYNFITDKGTFTILLANIHDGCYPHTVRIISEQINDEINL